MKLAGNILYWWSKNREEIDEIVDMPWMNRYFFKHLKIAVCTFILLVIAKLNGYGDPQNPMFIKDAMHLGG